jgi:hypothetical protein
MHQSNNLHLNIDSSSANARGLTFGQAQIEILSSVLEIGSRAAEDAAVGASAAGGAVAGAKFPRQSRIVS